MKLLCKSEDGEFLTAKVFQLKEGYRLNMEITGRVGNDYKEVYLDIEQARELRDFLIENTKETCQEK